MSHSPSENRSPSMRTYILLSHLVVVVASLLVIGLTLFLLSRQEDQAIQTALQRLSDLVKVVTSRPVIRDLPILPPGRQAAVMDRLAQETRARVLLVGARGKVLADNEGRLQETFLPMRRACQPMEGFLLQCRLQIERQQWLAAAAPLTLPAQGQTWLLLAQRAPPLAPLLDRLQTMLMGRFWLGLGIGLLAALLLALVTTRWIVHPLRQLATAARQVAQGDYQTEVPVEGPAEVHALAAEFNTMVRQVRASRDAQRDFVANVSHELKTPLTAIRGYAQAILDGAVEEPEAIQRAATIIYDEAGRMHRMVLQLLDLARLESGQVQMARRPVDLAALLSHLADRFRPRAEEAGITLITELPPLPTIPGDGDWLVQLFSNLLDNALKHTPAGGQIRLTARLVPDGRPSRRGAPPTKRIEVAVTDTGQGIPQEDLPRIFERFYQVDKSRRRTGSVGLGLAIAKEIVQAHGGTIHAESVQDVGTRFTVTLPVRLEG